jgi:putative membrane protein
VLARRADAYQYIPLLWAALIALGLPAVLLMTPLWLTLRDVMLAQWAVFIALAALLRIPALMFFCIPRAVLRWRAASLARRQFLEQNLHHTQRETGVLIFVAEAERYVEIIVDRGISRHIDDAQWKGIVDQFTDDVRRGETLQGFLRCIRSSGQLLHTHVPSTRDKDELPNHLVVIDS